MKEKYNIRFATKKDISSIVFLVRTAFEKKYLIPSVYRGKGIDEFILGELENNFSKFKYFLICEKDKVIGCAEFKFYSSDLKVFFSLLSIRNEYKSKGIGRILFEHCMRYFLNEGFKSIELDVYKTNFNALNWYERFGYKKVDSQSFYKLKLEAITQRKNDIYIQNYPQYKILHKKLGFSFLEVVIKDKSFKFGVVENDLIIRGSYDSSVKQYLKYLCEMLKLENIYFIGNPSKFKEFEFIDNIYRMKLNLDYDNKKSIK
ncbi:GNAT family N-acetyltransferase [Flavobacterium sp.]|uniref:GNAT family N-acetyltransferase n=1 Tax=Flavobacterium sp. TaxID=239 RepID=UPI0033429EFF